MLVQPTAAKEKKNRMIQFTESDYFHNAQTRMQKPEGTEGFCMVA